jgi:hypothetical protein
MNRHTFKSIIEWIISIEANIARRWSANAHRRLMVVQWKIPPKPQYFDHHIDLFYQWLKTRDAMWLERGVFSSMVLKGGKVLELSCGDGFNCRNFYSLRSSSIVACDIDENTIRKARRNNSAPNITYTVADIRDAMPDGSFDNVIWDFGFPLLEYFSKNDVIKIFKDIKSRIEIKKGIFSGYTVAQKQENNLDSIELNFSNAADLYNFLILFFDKVYVVEIYSPDRKNLYFWASDADLPFGNAQKNAAEVK